MPPLKLDIKATVGSRSDVSGHLKQPGDAVIVERQEPRWIVFSCPCGCGAEIPINLDRRAGPAWRLYRDKRGVSLYPSVWRDTDCKSHFILLRDRFLMFGPDYDDSWDDYILEDELRLEKTVREMLLPSQAKSYETLAQDIEGSIPWDVLRICRKLCRKNLAVEGNGKLRGWFKANQ